MTAPVLDPELLRGFVDVVARCLRATVGVDAVIAATTPAAEPSISVALEIRGDVRGPVTWVFPPEIARELVRRLLSDPHPPEESVTDGATELANILTGHASELLERHGFRCEIGVPHIHTGVLPAGVVLHLDTSKGPIDVVLSLTRAAA
jgi:CheY-specific phosphatase CheX|nr:chemotaxis protein CheX [Kofleriaceae bacterium]